MMAPLSVMDVGVMFVGVMLVGVMLVGVMLVGVEVGPAGVVADGRVIGCDGTIGVGPGERDPGVTGFAVLGAVDVVAGPVVVCVPGLLGVAGPHAHSTAVAPSATIRLARCARTVVTGIRV